MFDPDKRVLFYPSCGVSPGQLFELDFDLFVLADKGPRDDNARKVFYGRLSRNIGGVDLLEETADSRTFQKGDKIGYLLFKDNNEVLQIINQSAHRIDCFVGIRDGCTEGGNDECVNDREFFSKVLRLMPTNGMDYITDHASLLYTQWKTDPRREGTCKSAEPSAELILGERRILLAGAPSLNLSDNPISPVRQYKISVHKRTVREWRSKSTRVTLEHDDIANSWNRLDGTFISRRCRRSIGWGNREKYRIAPHHFFKPSLLPGWTTEDSVHLLLNRCVEMRWKTVGTTAFGEGNHSSLLSTLENWHGEYPEWIRIFHSEVDDFADITDRFQEIE